MVASTPKDKGLGTCNTCLMMLFVPYSLLSAVCSVAPPTGSERLLLYGITASLKVAIFYLLIARITRFCATSLRHLSLAEEDRGVSIHIPVISRGYVVLRAIVGRGRGLCGSMLVIFVFSQLHRPISNPGLCP